ncbi:hypothetical protein RIR_e4668_jg27306.t2 [Rhizophagus irregularis DAOM 181602=DAOM 197198]|nr:hypothetical protein RIR_e4668_jg27306.t2 [Rhizophagus irregularis DAOM 181602=DAOM 197198]
MGNDLMIHFFGCYYSG